MDKCYVKISGENKTWVRVPFQPVDLWSCTWSGLDEWSHISLCVILPYAGLLNLEPVSAVSSWRAYNVFSGVYLAAVLCLAVFSSNMRLGCVCLSSTLSHLFSITPMTCISATTPSFACAAAPTYTNICLNSHHRAYSCKSQIMVEHGFLKSYTVSPPQTKLRKLCPLQRFTMQIFSLKHKGFYSYLTASMSCESWKLP